MKKNIIPTLMNYDKNADFLKHVPHSLIADLAVVYRFVEEQEGALKAAVITHDVLRQMGLSFDELEALGRENFELYYTPELLQLDDSIWLLSNRQHLFGATGLLYKSVLDDIAAQIGEAVFIIPASVHEVLLTREKDADVEKLSMTLKINNEKIAGENVFLSENLYVFDLKSNGFSLR